jgi:hypothetical protein
MSGTLRSPTRLLLVAATILSLTALALGFAPSVLASSARSEDRSGHLQVTKDCSQNQGLADQFCTITSANLSEIKVGSRIVYLEAVPAPYTTLDSDIVLVVGTGNFALGHCVLPLPAGPGKCTLSGGRGTFSHFKASVVVTQDSTNPSVYFWNGTYSFGGDD